MKIIHHNGPVDIEKIIKQSYATHIGLDTTDFQNFTKNGKELHTFVSIEMGANRIKRGLEEILKHEENQFILDEAKSFMIFFSYSKDSKTPLSVQEIQESNEILDTYFSGKNILWGLAEDKGLNDSVRVIIMAKS